MIKVENMARQLEKIVDYMRKSLTEIAVAIIPLWRSQYSESYACSKPG